MKNVMTGEEYYKENPPLEVPTFFSTKKETREVLEIDGEIMKFGTFSAGEIIVIDAEVEEILATSAIEGTELDRDEVNQKVMRRWLEAEISQ
jgi:Fic family protein